ncbi:MAG: hypothetical protein HYY01_10925 [Chloroflexi bacterium]|nr:hypothetical protein [Chloroflexota bacterium]
MGGVAEEIPCITDLPALVSALPREQREVFRRLFDVRVVYGELRPPETMHPWLMKQFGSVASVFHQKIVRVTNTVTGDGALFNELRARRPLNAREQLGFKAQIMDGLRHDALARPLSETPEDVFGRIQGKYCITASNIAKYDGLHAIVIFDEPDPLRFDEEHLADYVDTAWRWAQAAHDYDPLACYFLFIWNCLWRAGATLIHGHAQVLLTRYSHYSRIERLRRAALGYGTSNSSDGMASYFQDVFRVHQALGLGWERDGVRVQVCLCPVKEKEVMIMGHALDDRFLRTVYRALACLRDRLGVTNFNVSLVTPPLSPTPERWDGFPVLVRAVDRGDPQSKSSDFGGMELYANPVVAADPFVVAHELVPFLGAA